MRRLTQSGGTSSGQSSNVGTSIGAEEHMDQTAVQRNHSEARAALAAQRAAEAAPGAAAGAMPGAQTSALAYGAGLWVGDAGQSKAEEDGDSEAGPSRPQPPPETAASQHRAEWLASLHEGSQLCVRVQAGRVAQGHAPGRRPLASRQGQGEGAPPGRRRLSQPLRLSRREDSAAPPLGYGVTHMYRHCLSPFL